MICCTAAGLSGLRGMLGAGCIADHPDAVEGAILGALGDAFAFQFGQPAVELARLCFAGAGESEQSEASGWFAVRVGDVAVGLALGGEAKERHPEAARWHGAPVERGVVGPVGPVEFSPAQSRHGVSPEAS